MHGDARVPESSVPPRLSNLVAGPSAATIEISDQHAGIAIMTSDSDDDISSFRRNPERAEDYAIAIEQNGGEPAIERDTLPLRHPSKMSAQIGPAKVRRRK